MRERWRTRFGRSMARPAGSAPRLPEPGPRGRVILGWIGAGLIVALVAFIVGRPSDDAGSAADAASAGPSASAAPRPIAFGTARDPVTLEVVSEVDTFRRGDTFAYSVPLQRRVGVDTVYVRVDRLDPDPQTVQDWSDGAQPLDGSLRVISFEVGAAALLDAFGAGDYEMTISLEADGSDVVAGGRFRLAEAASPS